MKIALEGPAQEVKIIQDLLAPWDITYTSLDDAEVAITYKRKPTDVKGTVIIPSDSKEFINWSKAAQIKVTKTNDNSQLIYTTADQAILSIKPKILYQYGNTPKFNVENDAVGIKTNGNFAIGVDVVSEYHKLINETLASQQSKLYKLATSLPLPYSVVPKKFRDYFMKECAKNNNLTLYDKLHVDALRLIIIQAINKITGKSLRRKTWSGNGFACLMTHDVENAEGLQRALCIKKLEEKYDLPSAWFIPSKRYTLKDEIVKTLINFGEVGSHDTKHDGKLAALSIQGLIERLTDAKRSLEMIANSPINGFRAPLLQHNFQIIEAVNASGYSYDASIPTWEPKHPYTMKTHGIGTVFPFYINNFPEIPLTLPQDHQMLHAINMSPHQTIDIWKQMMMEIKRIGGLCVFLTHPNELADEENNSVYEELLNYIVNEKDVHISLPTLTVKRF